MPHNDRRDLTMSRSTTVADRVLQFNTYLAEAEIDLPQGYAVVNPFSGPSKDHVRDVTTAFYKKFYNDDRPRRLVLGSSPARRGTAVTGVPFVDAKNLHSDTGIDIDGYAISAASSGFLDDVIHRYGGREKFYAEFFMSFVCPLGVVRTTTSGGEVNANYYENKKLLDSMRTFVVDTLERQLALGVDPSVCYCIGSGENFKFLSTVNAEKCLFGEIVPLEHPRFITQYNPERRDEFVFKYLGLLRGTGD